MLFLYIFAEAERAGQKGFDNGVRNKSLFIPPIHTGALLRLTPAIHTPSVLASQNRKKERKTKRHVSVDFDCGVNFPYEHVCSVETNRSR